MTTFPEIISTGMNNDSALSASAFLRRLFLSKQRHSKATYPQDALRADQLNKVILDAAGGNPLRISLDIPQVPNVSFGILRSTMILPKWVEVGAGRSAAISVVAKLVDVHSTSGVRVVSLDIIGDSSRRILGLLLEPHDAGDVGVSSDDSNWKVYPSVGRIPDVQGCIRSVFF